MTPDAGPPPSKPALHPALWTLVLLGVASGLPFDLGNATLQSWLADAAPGLSMKDLGLFTLAGLPYVLKPLWSPLLDRFEAPYPFARLGRRRGWMALAQLACAGAIAAMALSSPEDSPFAIGLYALVLAFFSASQDIVVDAWRADVLPPSARGLGAALASWGYRLGMMLAGFLAPVLAVRAGLGWSGAYLVMAAIMAVGPLATLLAPAEPRDAPAPRTLRDAVVLPLRDLGKREGALALLALVATYKLGDAFGSSLLSAFLQRGLGFKPDEVAALRKTVGVLAVLGGMALGGVLMLRLRLYTALIVFGLLQAVTNLGFVALAGTHRDFLMLGLGLVAENLATGLGAVAFVAFLTALCDPRFSATQYALLSALAVLGSKVIGPVAGPVADALGWAPFFLISAFAAIPGLLLVLRSRSRLLALDKAREA